MTDIAVQIIRERLNDHKNKGYLSGLAGSGLSFAYTGGGRDNPEFDMAGMHAR